jgi:DNA polymerase-4
MGLMKSARLAPDAILLPANFEAYRHYSRLFKAAVAHIAPVIEDRGIDEIYIDLSNLAEDSQTLARDIKRAVFAATGLTCSIGISPNKLLSKIGSDLNKPDGVTILEQSDVPTRIWPLAARKINGIGPKATEKLQQLGIHTIGELAATRVDFLMTNFGSSTGAWMHRAANGVDDRAVITASEPKSISRETTFERDLDAQRDRSELSGIFTALCFQVADDLARKGYVSRTIGIKLRYKDFRIVTRDVTVHGGARTGAEIRQAAGTCLKRVDLDQRIRLLGVRAGGLVSTAKNHGSLPGVQAHLPF